jgi:Domain of unknown function (DUF4389)
MANRAERNAPLDYPAKLELDAPPEIANWRPLVQWFLAIPHLVLANVFQSVAGVIGVISWFAIVFTGQLPEGLAKFQCLMIRYQARAYSYVLFLREPYPPFEFQMTPEDPGGDPLRVDLAPELENRNRLTVGLRIFWLIPIVLFFIVVSIAAFFVALVALFAVLFTGRWPEGMRRFMIGFLRLSVRVSAYCYVLVDEYPPFSLE